MVETIIISSSLASPQSSQDLYPFDDSPTSTPPDEQPENNPAYLSVALEKPRESTPVRNTQQTSADCSASPPLLVHALRIALDEEMRQCFIGPLSINKFFNDFLPVDDAPPPSVSSGFTKMAKANLEKQMYRCFVRSSIPLTFLSSSDDKSSRSTP